MSFSDEMYLPATSKWVTGTIRRRPVHCYLYSNALVIISNDKKVGGATRPSSYHMGQGKRQGREERRQQELISDDKSVWNRKWYHVSEGSVVL